MKAKYIFLPSIIIGTTGLLFSSCQKDISTENGILPAQNGTHLLTDSIYLDKIVYLETNGGVTDTSSVTFYEYDAAHRVTALYFANFVSPGNYIPFYRTEYAYTGSDTLPFKSTDLDLDATSTSRDTTVSFFTFSGTKRIKDSVMYFNNVISAPAYRNVSKQVINYQYAPGKIYGTESDVLISSTDINQTPGIVYSSIDTASLDAAGNLVTYDLYDQSGALQMNAYFTYDSKRNPFSLLSNYFALWIFPSNETFIDEMQAANNRLHAHEVSGINVSYDEDLTGKYIYKANNLPASVTDDDGTGNFYKVIFVYKAF